MRIVSEPWGGGKGLVSAHDRDTRGNQGRQSEPPEGRRRHEGTHAAAPPRTAGRRREGEGARDGGPHEVSRAGAEIASRDPGGSPRGSLAETGERRGRAGRGGHTELLIRPGSGALSLADPMEPPPSVVPGRGNGVEGTPDRLGLSRGPEDSLPARLIGRTYFRQGALLRSWIQTLCRRVYGPRRSF